MGINCNGVGGIGIKVDDEIISDLIEYNQFTEEEWNDVPYECMDVLELEYKTAGGVLNDEEYYYLIVSGENLTDVLMNAPEFLGRLELLGVKKTVEDLIVISDYYIS